MKIRHSLLILIYGATLIQALEWNSGSNNRQGTGTTCSALQFKCKNGDCIPSERLCDGRADCRDKSDETEFECRRPEIRCHRKAFRCSYGACVDGDAVCNGVRDCLDGSDELLPQCSNNSSSNVVETSNFSNCTDEEFKCNDGQCINYLLICDGKADCRDRSDETIENCASSNCLGKAFRCAYGACIDGDLKCNNVRNCVDGSDEDWEMCSRTTFRPFYDPTPKPVRPPPVALRPQPGFSPVTPRPPPGYSPVTPRPTPVVPTKPCRIPAQPEKGRWKLHMSQCPNRRNCQPDPWVESLGPGSHLVYSCDDGFKLEGNENVFCGPQGMWADLPRCVEIRCKSLVSASTQVECSLNKQWRSCENGADINTVAQITCRSSYQPDPTVLTQRDSVTCNSSGEWEPQPIRCIPVCGVTTTKMKPFIVRGTAAKVGDFPWHATLYMRRNNKIEFICGASIVRRNVLLTAAHCVFNEDTAEVEDASLFYIVTGNIFQDYDSRHHNNRTVKKRRVKNIYVQCNYIGFDGNYAWDIAILQIDEPFTFTASLMPICLDPSGQTEKIALSEGSLGRVAGFGRTATGNSSSYLQTLSVPYVSSYKCKVEAGESDKFITLDKFCAGFKNGSSVCNGDSGGGLVFNNGRLWYLQGIVSAGLEAVVLGVDRVCDSFSYTLYTQMSSHIRWIQDILTNIETNEVVPPCPKRKKKD